MKRDMDLCREILLAIEQSDAEPLGWIDIDLPGHSPQQVSYNVMQLAQAGLITAKDLSTMSGFTWKPKSLTWQGHEFLDAARNDTIWRKATGKLVAVTGGTSLEVLKELLIAGAKQAVGLEP